MAEKVLMLAKNYDLKKLTFPLVLTEKLDGVAADFYANRAGGIEVRSRQNEPLYSVQHIAEWLTGKLSPGDHLICELFIPGKDFKDIGGLVRRKSPSPELIAYIYDFYQEGQADYAPFPDLAGLDYIERIKTMGKKVGKDIKGKSPVQLIPGKRVNDVLEFQDEVNNFFRQKPNAEGVMIRALRGKDSGYEIGKRSWGMQRLKPTATVDLEVHSFEEAVDAEGTPKGMVGRINVLFLTDAANGNRSVEGIGPGALTHKERIEIWNNQKRYIGQILEADHKPDPSYNGLREGRFKRWRPDKETPNQE